MAKKTTAKKSAAPAKKAVKKNTSKVAKKTAAKAAPKKTAASKAAAKTKSSGQIAIRVLIDVGFGNHLFIRGEGAGLNWDVGQPMACLGTEEWQWTSTSATRPILFKVLINDHVWSVGDDFVASPGEISVIEPGF